MEFSSIVVEWRQDGESRAAPCIHEMFSKCILVIENLLLLFVHCIQSYVYVPFGKLSITSALAVGLSMRGQAIPFSETFIDTWGFASFDRIF